jgi:hypothetical protein
MAGAMWPQPPAVPRLREHFRGSCRQPHAGALGCATSKQVPFDLAGMVVSVSWRSWDPKPNTEFGGDASGLIPTLGIPGIHVTRTAPWRTALGRQHLAIIRSLCTEDNAHFGPASTEFSVVIRRTGGVARPLLPVRPLQSCLGRTTAGCLHRTSEHRNHSAVVSRRRTPGFLGPQSTDPLAFGVAASRGYPQRTGRTAGCSSGRTPAAPCARRIDALQPAAEGTVREG